MGESRSISESHKSNLVQNWQKNHQLKDKLHTKCELEQDNFRFFKHETCYYQVYITT